MALPSGGGCELALACTLRIASTNARLGQPEVKIGIIPGYGGTQRLPRLIGKGAALKMILTGEAISAAEALRLGLVDEVVAADQLLARAEQIAQTIAGMAPLAIRDSIRAVNSGYDLPLASGLELEASLFGLACSTSDKAEGTQAFLEKRAAELERKMNHGHQPVRAHSRRDPVFPLLCLILWLGRIPRLLLSR